MTEPSGARVCATQPRYNLRHRIRPTLLPPVPTGRTPEAGLGRAAGRAPQAVSKLILGPNIKPSEVSGQDLEETEGNVLDSEKRSPRKNLHA